MGPGDTLAAASQACLLSPGPAWGPENRIPTTQRARWAYGWWDPNPLRPGVQDPPRFQDQPAPQLSTRLSEASGTRPPTSGLRPPRSALRPGGWLPALGLFPQGRQDRGPGKAVPLGPRPQRVLAMLLGCPRDLADSTQGVHHVPAPNGFTATQLPALQTNQDHIPWSQGPLSLVTLESHTEGRSERMEPGLETETQPRSAPKCRCLEHDRVVPGGNPQHKQRAQCVCVDGGRGGGLRSNCWAQGRELCYTGALELQSWRRETCP